MRALAFALVTACATACAPQYINTLAPKDAKFDVSCGEGCGKHERDASTVIDVRFGEKYLRRFNVCCNDKAAVMAQLITVRDMWCSGLAVPPKAFGGLTIGTTTSEINGKRAATLDQGEMYVTFQCDDWLPKLIERLDHASCCATAAAP